MKDKLVSIKLHGVLADQIGRDIWKLSVSSVGEALRAIDAQSKKLFSSFIQNDKDNIKYRVLINNKDFLYDESQDLNTEEGVRSSELAMNHKNLESIDIVPVIEGADFKDVFAIVTGIVLIALGVWVGVGTFLGGSLVVGGIGLMAAGIANLLMPMPEFGDFREIEGGGRRSYLFAGPENTVREGGPVYIGYGRLLVGSQVIQSSIQTFDVASGETKNRKIGDLTKYPYWGEEYYGLDYRDKVKNNAGTVQKMIAQRRKDWTSTKGKADECGPENKIIKHGTTIVTADGDDFVVDRNMPIEKDQS